MTQLRIKSHAKINLALNITGKSYLLHKIETIVSFISLHDEIFIKKINSKKHNIIFTGKFSRNISKDNTISKLLEILENKDLLKNKKFKILVNKKIPNRAGLGGGSMNAANILKYFVKKKIIRISKKGLEEISNLIGSDVVLGLNSTNSILNSKNQIKRFKNYKKYYVLLVKPNFGCSTKYIYSKVKKFNRARLLKPNKSMFNYKFLKKIGNSLEPIAFSKYNKLKIIKSFLEKSTKPIFVRMSGSGSVIVAYFKTKDRCEKAKKQFNKKYKKYWCMSSKTI
jgi:4-diphosphocytidyl-2-C-methyl-D-erythritol kinase